MKIDAYLLTRKNSDGKYPIRIRITKNRKSHFKSIGYSISKRHWNDKSHRVRESYDNHEELNNHIEKKIRYLEDKYSTKSTLFKINREELSFFEYFKLMIDNIKTSNKIADLKKHRVVLKHLKTFMKNKYQKDDLLFIEIDDIFLGNLKAYFDGIGLKSNTQNGYFKKIKHKYYKSIENHHFIPIRDPFLTFKNPSSSAQNKSLEIDEISSVEIFNPFQYDFKPKIKNLPTTRVLFDVKNTFLFQFYMRGMRVSDLVLLKWKNINNRYIEYEMRKTGKLIKIPINNKLIYILRLYMPFTLKNQYFQEKNYNDREMFYSLDKNEMTKISSRLKPMKYPDFPNYSYYYKIKSTERLLNKFNYLSIHKEYKEQYIFNLLSETQIKRLQKTKQEDYTKIEYNIIQSAAAQYNKRLKHINSFFNDVKGQYITTPITSHLARHTYASIAVELGLNVFTISKSLGHKDLKTTQLYLNTLNDELVDDENEIMFKKMNDRIESSIEKTKNIKILSNKSITKLNKS